MSVDVFLGMITEEEKKFLKYWKENREKESKLSKQIMAGLPWGLLIGAGVGLSLITGEWYQRATMVANAELSPLTLFFAITAISIFTGVFYKKHKWEMNEQHYKEILYKLSKKE